MFKVAIFCVPGCTVAVRTLDYFSAKGRDISLVVMETATRDKYSLAEREFKAAHDEFRKFLRKETDQNGTQSLSQKMWLRVPKNMRSLVKRLLPQSLESKQDIATKVAKKLNVPIEKVDKHSSELAKNLLERYDISYVLLGSSNWLIKEPLLSMQNTKIINAHCAKLPRHRSLDALPWSVMEDDEIGLTTHFVDSGIDTGPILRFLEVTPQLGDNLLTLRERVNQHIPQLFWDTVVGLWDKTIIPRSQHSTEGLHHRPMTVEQLLKAEKLLQERIRRGITA